MVIISGDIAESHNVVDLVTEMKQAVEIPVYFVLGNHDFYGSSVQKVHRNVKALGHLLNQPVEVDKNTIMIGVDGWGDCRYGDYENSRLVMNDWIYIDDLRPAYRKSSDELKATLQGLADKDAQKLCKAVKRAIKSGYQKIIIVTHVPPFEEAALHAGRKSTPSGLPFFAPKILGETILPLARKHPEVDFLWLSGHTHSRASFKTCSNMTVKVADAQYYQPQIEEVFEYGD